MVSAFNVPLMAPANIYTSREETMFAAKEDIYNMALQNMRYLAIDYGLKNLKHKFHVQEGKALSLITDSVKKDKIDMVVMGTKGKTGARGIFMGSITKKVIQNATCPVLAIPEGAQQKDIKNIVYTTDLKHDETAIINYLIEFAKLYDAVITVLHIDNKEETNAWSIDLLKSITYTSEYPFIFYKEMIEGSVIEGIDKYIEREQPDMLAMGTHTASLFDKIFHKSITKQMLLHTHIPLLAFNLKKTKIE